MRPSQAWTKKARGDRRLYEIRGHMVQPNQCQNLVPITWPLVHSMEPMTRKPSSILVGVVPVTAVIGTVQPRTVPSSPIRLLLTRNDVLTIVSMSVVVS